MYESRGMGDYCEPVVRFHVAASPLTPQGWISERGRYSRHPYRIADRVPPPSEDTPFELSHLSITLLDPEPLNRLLSGGGSGGGSGGEGVELERLGCRYRMLQRLNRLMLSTLAYVDLSLLSQRGSVASLLSGTRHLIFGELKLELWEAGLERSAVDGSSFELHLSRSLAARHKASGLPDVEAKYTIFAQAFRQLRTLPAASFRLKPGAVLYHTVLKGEMAHDAGGPYRETFALYCDDLQSGALSLFVRCPNAVNNVGANREKWVPNPGARSTLELEMFGFLGRLLGLGIRTRQCLDLNLPSLVWRQLVGSPRSREDLEQIDMMLVQSMDSIRHIHKQVRDAIGNRGVWVATYIHDEKRVDCSDHSSTR